MAALTPTKLNEIIIEYVTETIREDERDRATRNYNYSNVGKKLNSDSYDQMLLNIEEYIAFLKERLAYGEHADEMKSEADKVVDQHNLKPLDDDDYQFLCFKLHQAAIKAQEVVLKHWQKAATLFGFGLHLYRNDRTQGAYRQPNQNRNAGNGNNGGNGHGNGRSYRSDGNSSNGSSGYRGNGGNGNGGQRGNCNGGNGNNGNGRLTSNQYKYILRLGEERGQSLDELDRSCLVSFGSVVQHLSKNDASNLIQKMLVS